LSELVDAKFAAEERAALLDEVRAHLPAFLAAATAERVDPVGDVRELLNLRSDDLRRVIAVHFALSNAVSAFVEGLRAGLRRPVTSSIRPRVVTQAIRGPIDWGATVRHRATGEAGAGVYVVRPAHRVFDTPENRALVWTLARLDAESKLALPHADFQTTTGWQQQITLLARAPLEARRHPWIRSVPAETPGAPAISRLRNARTRFYKVLLPGVIDALSRYVDDPGPEEVTELLCARYFEPQLTWQLFEIAVALRLARGFAEVAVGKRRARLLVGTGRAPFAAYKIADGHEIRLWYQAWPIDIGPSLHANARTRHRIQATGTRPDIVIERVGARPSVIVLELKATRNASYLGQGLSQLLAYAHDRKAALNEPACAWLVAPASTAFEGSPPPEDEPLWVVDAESVATAAVGRLAS
jgi:hypothetical protein